MIWRQCCWTIKITARNKATVMKMKLKTIISPGFLHSYNLKTTYGHRIVWARDIHIAPIMFHHIICY
jgi:hypothetical protein